MTIYLIGMMGSGKSTIGALLSNKMDKPFVDLDLEIEKSAGKSISEIFEEDGKDYFRDLESKQLKQFTNSVIACGGGIVLRKENRRHMIENGKSVLLTASISELANRLPVFVDRPLLVGESLKERLTQIWLQRQTYYLSTADLTIKTVGRSPEEITTDIVSQLHSCKPFKSK